MALPTSYTETTFADYLHGILSHTANALGWSVAGGDYAEIVNDALLIAGVSDITTVAGAGPMRLLRIAGQIALWQAVVAAFVGDYDFEADGGRYDRDQLFQHAKAMLAMARGQGVVAGLDVDGDGGTAWEVQGGTVGYAGDPYTCTINGDC